jgi:PPOX class probable F420-dependent enzyme
MHKMAPAEYRAFLMEGTRTGKLATTRADGRPHVVPIWFVLDGDTLVFTTGAATVKGRNMQRDPRVCITVDDENPPYSFVMIEGSASLSSDMGEMLHWATQIGGRYMGADQAEAFGRRNAVEGELLVRVTPTNIIATKDIAD